MAWHMTEFYNAVHDRLKSDATLMALIDGVASVRAPDAWTTYIATAVQTIGTEDQAFRTLARSYRLLVQVVNPADDSTALALQGQIAERIEGNWYEKPFGVQPDYGLARWKPTLASWDVNPLVLFDIQTLAAGDNQLALGMAFDVLITREAAL